MRRRIGFVPRDVVENFKSQRLQREADAEYIVVGARNPDRAIGLEQAMTFAQPVQVKGVNLLEGRGFVPLAFVDRNHAPALASHAAARQKIRRIGEDEIEGCGFGAVQKREGIALIQTQTAPRIEPVRFGIGLRNSGFNFGARGWNTARKA